MSDKLGYTPSPAGPGKDGYNTFGSGDIGSANEKNAHRKTKKCQDGQEAKNSGPNAGDCLSNNNAVVNGNPDGGSY